MVRMDDGAAILETVVGLHSNRVVLGAVVAAARRGTAKRLYDLWKVMVPIVDALSTFPLLFVEKGGFGVFLKLALTAIVPAGSTPA